RADGDGSVRGCDERVPDAARGTPDVAGDVVLVRALRVGERERIHRHGVRAAVAHRAAALTVGETQPGTSGVVAGVAPLVESRRQLAVAAVRKGVEALLVD